MIKLYVMAIIVLFVIYLIGKAEMLRKSDFTRNPKFMVGDMIIALAMIMWGVASLFDKG